MHTNNHTHHPSLFVLQYNKGIGITLVTGGAFGDRSAVVSVKKGSLGARAGLRPGDVISSVNGVSMVGRTHLDVVAAIKVSPWCSCAAVVVCACSALYSSRIWCLPR